jgi:uncharacterized protein (DUF1800 family)
MFTTVQLLLALLQAPAAAPAAALVPELAWDAARAEHLLNRAGFGASTAELERALAMGPAKLVDELLTVESWIEEPFYARKRADGELGKYVRSLPEEEREERMDELRADDRAQVVDFLDWWVERMLAGDEPLRERMVLFWHGHFTSSMESVKSSYEMIQQNQLFRRHALGSFRELLYGVARDPAMLVYLDNASSKKDKPNENFARELLELYTLGEGHYSEDDVRDVARAFTGYTQRNGRFFFDARRHDRGPKRVLGVEGDLKGEDVLEILLSQEACARHLAQALLFHFEGRQPGGARLARYAGELRESGYRIDSFLRSLFLDPEFYRDEARASRVSSPLDYLVGSAHRAGVRPEARVVVTGAALLGQRLFFPPSVRGWEGGLAWATGSSLVVRGQLAGMLLGLVQGRELVAGGDAPDEEKKRVPAELRALGRLEPAVRLNLTQRLCRGGVKDDAALARALVDELLAVPAPEPLVAEVAERLTSARAEQKLGDAPWSMRPDIAEPLLRALAHRILALPEAQLD